MQRRMAFTLVELLVAMALIVFMMIILSEAFSVGLESYRRLKAIGDMNGRLRTAAAVLRRDLDADHFEGKRRLSDPAATWTQQGLPREGFFRIYAPALTAAQAAALSEGTDGDNIPSRRRTHHILQFSVKLRGNDRQDFFPARVPPGSPLLSGRTNFFDQAADARYQDEPEVFRCQWAEVAYFLQPNGESAGPTPLYALYRSQYAVVPDNSQLNWPPAVPVAELPQYAEVSCKPDPQNPGSLYFNNPTDLTVPARRAFDPLAPDVRAATLLLVDVISFDVQVVRVGSSAPTDENLDTASARPAAIGCLALTLRVWDLKTRQTRQVTILQDM